MSFKMISYRGGIARFKIPANWREEYETSGGAMFYEDLPNSGTLRVSVIGFQSDKPNLPADFAFASLNDLGGSRVVGRLPQGRAIARYDKCLTEEGRELLVRYWEIAVPVPPRRLRIVVFSFTIPSSRAAEQAVQSELGMLDSSILNAEFSEEEGAVGDYPQSEGHTGGV